MMALTLVTATVCLFVCVYGTFPQYDSAYFDRSNGYPYGRHGPYFPPSRLAFLGAFGSARGEGAGSDGTSRRPNDDASRSTGEAAKTDARPQRPLQKLPLAEVYVNPQNAVASYVLRTTDQYFYKPVSVGFDNVTTNINGGYMREYGVFTAPVPGIYSISYHVQTKKGSPKEAHVDLTQNGEVVNSAKAEGDCVTASNSAILYLDQFDRLSVSGRKGTVIGCENNGFCSFSISLVKQGKFHDQKVTRAVPMDKW